MPGHSIGIYKLNVLDNNNSVLNIVRAQKSLGFGGVVGRKIAIAFVRYTAQTITNISR